MVSLLVKTVTRGLGVPAKDRRLLAHAKFRVDVDTNDGPAAPAKEVEAEAPAVQQTSDAKADEARGDGTHEEG